MTVRQRLEIGLTHHRAGRLREAEDIYRQVLAEEPNHPEALQLLAGVATQIGRYDTAIDLLDKAIQANPNVALFHGNIGSLYLKIQRLDEAVAALERALQLDPQLAPAYYNLGGALSDKGEFHRAAAVFRTGISLNPHWPELHNVLGFALRDCGDYDESLAAFRRSVALRPDFADGHRNLGMTLLLLGDFRNGWAEYEWRLKMPQLVQTRNTAQPKWDGQTLEGKTILLYPEQGFGDAFQFIRYAPLVAKRGGKVIVECVPELAGVLRGVEGVERVITRGDSWPSYDVQSSIMSLPLAFGTTLETIPAEVPYLAAAPDRVAAWRERLGNPDGRRRVGLVWAGRPEHPNDRRRSMRLDQFAPLAEVKSARFYSLQKGPAASQAAAPPPGMDFVDWTADLHDFADTAALIANLDLVICVDTSVAHLAGAMAKPVWVLLHSAPDWRWMLNRTDSPWYPTMRLFRQAEPGNWTGVIANVSRALSQMQNQLK
ncbi:MAG: tetratricopeptide repeat-containing glycosyltransferase family protein [Tepidisphaeraceae bacterium]